MEKIIVSERNDRLIRFKTGKAVLTYGYWEEQRDGETVGCSWYHVWYVSPTNEEVVKAITDAVNAQTDEKILSGYVWNGINVWLSRENQFNFKAAYDVAVQSNGAILPVNFKLGEDERGNPLYYTFSDMDEFVAFYTGAIMYIQQTLAEGWQEKDRAREMFG